MTSWGNGIGVICVFEDREGIRYKGYRRYGRIEDIYTMFYIRINSTGILCSICIDNDRKLCGEDVIIRAEPWRRKETM